MKISVIIPFYNEENQIPQTVNTVLSVINTLDYDYELILIDDGSTDNTWQYLEKATEYKRVDNHGGFSGEIKAFGFSRNFGKEAALSAGLNVANSDAVILMDGDLQHPPKHIPYMIKLWQENNVQIVEGVKKNRNNDSLLQKINAFMFYKIFSKVSGYDLTNASDFKLLDRQVVEEWKNLKEHDTFFRALSVWLGFKRENFYFEVPKRVRGNSKWPRLRLLKLSINAITSFSAIPLHLISVMGAIFLVASIILGIQTLIKWIMGTAAIGFTTVILLQLVIGGFIMISLGLIGIYIARIFTEVKGRPRYIISRQSTKNN